MGTIVNRRLSCKISVHLRSLFIVIIAITGCGVFGGEQADLTFINNAEPESLDPAHITGQVEWRVTDALFEGLTTRDPQTLEPRPGVAERWEISGDGLVYTFSLRDCTWSNGQPVTAEDFVYSWKRVLEPETAASYAYQLYYIVNAEKYNAGALKDFSQVGIRARDEKTLEIRLNASTPYFLGLTSFFTLYPVHKACVEAYGQEWTKPGNIVTNGPYILSEWRLNHRIRLVKNDAYWNSGEVRLATIDILPVESSTTAFNIYETRGADWIDGGAIPPNLVEFLRGRDDFHESVFWGTYFYRFNTTSPPFNDRRVRIAFDLAVDKQKIVEKITRGGQIPAATYVPPGVPAYRSCNGREYDPDAARELLAQAGYPDGTRFPDVTLLYNTSELHRPIAVEIQSMWQKELNVHVELHNQEWKVYLNSVKELDYDIARASWIGDYLDPNTFLDMFVTGSGNNRTGWSFLEYDDLIARAAQEHDQQRRMEYLRQAEKILVFDEMPIMPIYYYIAINLYDDARIGGIYPNIMGYHPFRAIWIKK